MRSARAPARTQPSPRNPTPYQEGGPAAEARFEAGVAGFEARAFRGCGVVTSEPFEVSDDNESLQMLTRSSQVGEFYVMSPPQVKPKGETGEHTCDIMLFDEERDTHVRITWEDALKATLVKDPEFMKNRAPGTKMQDGKENKSTLKTWMDAADKWNAYNKGVASGARTWTRTSASSWRAPSSST